MPTTGGAISGYWAIGSRRNDTAPRMTITIEITGDGQVMVTPFLPPGTRLVGKARIGLRCVRGPTRWNVYLPVSVRLYGQGLVVKSPLA